MSFIKYKKIPHLPGSKHTDPDDSSVLRYPTGEFFVFEKLDGTNIGIGYDKTTGTLTLQNRGGYLKDKRPHEQWGEARRWVMDRAHVFLPYFEENPNTILFGEFLYARHSIKYDTLPDYFILFDIWNGREWASSYYTILATARRLGLNNNLPPMIERTSDITKFLSMRDRVIPKYSEQLEGFIFRKTDKYSIVYKYVMPTFVAGIEEHWFNRKVEVNGLR